MAQRRNNTPSSTAPAMSGRRKIVRRRLALLALAMAVPAMAAGGNEGATSSAANLQTYPIRIALPAATPLYQPMFPAPRAQQTFASAGAIGPAITFASDPGPAALPLAISGSATDQIRAQRCLTMAVYYEAASEGEAGQRAVAQVVMNRVAHGAFPANVCGVVFQGSQRSTGCQFSFTCDGSLARTPQQAAMARASRVARDALAGSVFAGAGLATHYHRSDMRPYWASSLNPLARIGAHSFYSWRGTNGQRAAFNAAYAGSEPLPASRMAIAATQAIAEAPPAPAAAPAPTPAPAPAVTSAPAPAAIAAQPALPTSTVREEYAASGQWLVQP